MSIRSWVHAQNGLWTTSIRWSPSGAPTSADDAIIAETGAGYTVVMKGSEAVHSLTINSADATLRVDNPTGSLAVTDAINLAAGTLQVNGGDVVADSLNAMGGALTFTHGGNFVTDTLNIAGGGTFDINFVSPGFGTLEVTTSVTTVGTGVGTINLSGGGGALYLDGTQTLDNVTINIGAGGLEQLNGSPANLTLGPNCTINQTGLFVGIDQLATIPTTTLINQGTINVGGMGGFFTIQPLHFTNQGTINGNGSGSLLSFLDGNINSTFANEGTINISNGFSFNEGAHAFTNSGTIAISSGGIARLNDDANVGRGTSPVNHGLIELADGTLAIHSSVQSAYHLDNAADGTITGHGTVDGLIDNSGLIEANGGTLTLHQAVSGTGGLQIDAGATLVLDSTLSSTVAVAFDGAAGSTLKIALPASFASTIGGIGLDDIIDLAGITADGVTLNGSNQLVVTDHGTVVDTLQLSGDNRHLGFTVESDGNGGTNIIAVPGDVIWARAVNGDFDDAGKWNPSLVPGETSDVIVARAGVSITDSADHTINSLRINNASTTLEVSHASLTVNGEVFSNGTLIADDASIHIGGNQRATGTFAIDGDSTIEFGAFARGHVTFGADGQGTLALDQSSAFKGDITGFGNGDTFDFNDIVYSTAPGAKTLLKYTDNGTGNGGTLLVKDAAGDFAKLAMVGHYTADNFVMTDDGHGHAQVHFHDLLV